MKPTISRDRFEKVAMDIAWDEVHDHVSSDHWFGYPDPEKPDEMEKAAAKHLERSRCYLRDLIDRLGAQVEETR